MVFFSWAFGNKLHVCSSSPPGWSQWTTGTVEVNQNSWKHQSIFLVSGTGRGELHLNSLVEISLKVFVGGGWRGSHSDTDLCLQCFHLVLANCTKSEFLAVQSQQLVELLHYSFTVLSSNPSLLVFLILFFTSFFCCVSFLRYLCCFHLLGPVLWSGCSW